MRGQYIDIIVISNFLQKINFEYDEFYRSLDVNFIEYRDYYLPPLVYNET